MLKQSGPRCVRREQVSATVEVVSPSVATTVKTSVEALTPQAASSALGVTVIDTEGHRWYVGKNGKGDKAKAKPPKPAGLCFAFQKGECYRGDGCHFRHEWEGGEGEAAAPAAAPAKSKAVTYGASLWE